MRKRSRILIEDPELGEELRGARLSRARKDCLAPMVHVPAGTWSQTWDSRRMRKALGLLVLDGLIIRRVGVAGRFGAELLGDGDLLRPWEREDAGATLPRAGRWRALRPCRLALLDGDFALQLARYPEITSVLLSRAVRRSRHMAVGMAIVHQPRIDVRLHMLFWELADRWGAVHPDGVHVPFHLTHAVLADLVVAQRQTVTKALSALADRGAVRWTGEYWLLHGKPPTQL